ncbi:MAG TPA: cytochrome c3 family protein [Puia sp.]|nr:cytochrome c3 family protein [Puia sp.]
MLHYFRKIRASHYVVLILLVAIYLCTRMCTPGHRGSATPIRDGKGEAFAGSASCASCHKDIYDTHIKTAHYRDSKPAAKEFIRGSFDSGHNHFVYTNEREVILQQQGSHFFQTALLNGQEYRRESFDIVIGSGRKGQTYLYWDSARLCQLPISYYTALNSWCNSPGFPNNEPRFNRQVQSYCMECHSTYARTVGNSNAETGYFYDKDQIIYGIDCEKCHGAAAEHVAFHTAHPGAATGRFIINAQRLSRQQRLDGCALCHSGPRSPLRPAFSFTVGDRLNDFSMPGYAPDSAANLDVHGNQYGLLTASKCFKLSQMDCSSCHNVHVNEAGSLKVFSQKCMTCHNTTTHDTCTVKSTPGLVLSDNCIDCHMPARPSQKIILTLSGASQTVHDLVRTHRIAIYSLRKGLITH